EASRLYDNDETTAKLKNNYLTNDWQYLYRCYKVENNNLSNIIEREIKLDEVFYNVSWYVPLAHDKHHRANNNKQATINELNNFDIILNEDVSEWLKDVSVKIFKELDETNQYINYNTRKAIKQKMINVLIYLLTNGKIGNVSEVKGREYSALTQTPKALRSIIPIKFISVDLTSANP